MADHTTGAGPSLDASPYATERAANEGDTWLASTRAPIAREISLDLERSGAADPAGSFVPSTPAPPPTVGVQTRLQKGIRQPEIYTDGTVRYALLTAT